VNATSDKILRDVVRQREVFKGSFRLGTATRMAAQAKFQRSQPHTIVDDPLLNYCAFEEMERGLPE
jgi:hypothetical protein